MRPARFPEQGEPDVLTIDDVAETQAGAGQSGHTESRVGVRL
jgi:hypothetical protein